MPRACPEFRHLATIVGSNFQLSVDGDGPSGLVQSYQAQLQRQVSVIYDLASDGIYMVEGSPQGQLSLERVLGPSPTGGCTVGSLIECRCDPMDVTLTSGAEACDNDCGNLNIQFKNVYQAAFQLQSQVQDRVVRYSATYLFTHVESS